MLPRDCVLHQLYDARPDLLGFFDATKSSGGCEPLEIDLDSGEIKVSGDYDPVVARLEAAKSDASCCLVERRGKRALSSRLYLQVKPGR
jgi:hypothetical protein